MVLISTIVLTGNASIAIFTNVGSGSYEAYRLTLHNLRQATAGGNIILMASADKGVTYGAVWYRREILTQSSLGSVTLTADNTDHIRLMTLAGFPALGNSGLSGNIDLIHGGKTTDRSQVVYHVGILPDAGNFGNMVGAGWFNSTEINTLKVEASYNITGTMRLYGISKK